MRGCLDILPRLKKPHPNQIVLVRSGISLTVYMISSVQKGELMSSGLTLENILSLRDVWMGDLYIKRSPPFKRCYMNRNDA